MVPMLMMAVAAAVVAAVQLKPFRMETIRDIHLNVLRGTVYDCTRMDICFREGVNMFYTL